MRPISLLCCDFKILEKVLANRLKPALEQIISQDQKGYMSSRRINCNICRVLDLIQYTDMEDLPGVVISIDFMKCFDLIEHSALLSALSYFNIGESYQKWVKLTYNNATSCVTNAGHFTPFFKVTRSVRQGGPNSAYLFLVIAEVLAIELRKNKNIKGFEIKEIMRILGQFADDMDLYLWGDAKSVTYAFNVIDDFCRQSGFRINYDKTTILRIGSIKKSNAKFYTKKNVAWVEQMNILGVEISAICDKKLLQKINYDKITRKIEGILSAWRARNLSLIGKVLIINSLVGSLFVYKMSVLPAISTELVQSINKQIQNFIWNDKRPKIPLQTMQKSKEEGGLALVDLHKKDQAIKISWIQILQTDKIVENLAYKQLCGTLREKIWEINLKEKDIQ